MGLFRITPLSVITGLLLSYLLTPSLFPPPPGPLLSPIPRIPSSSLTFQDFVSNHLLPGVPVIITHDEPDRADGRIVRTALLSSCGKNLMSLLSETIR